MIKIESDKNNWLCEKHNAFGNTGYCPFCKEDKKDFRRGLIFAMLLVLIALLITIFVSI
jgi:hypothetical protein